MKASDGSTEVTTLHAVYDGVGNITRFFHDRADNSVVIGFQYDHDKIGNPSYKLREHQSSYGDEYMYDKFYRLTRTVYDDSTPAAPTASPAAAATDSFGYDSIGNRTSCSLKSATATSYLHNPVNEYTKESTGGTDKYYGSDAAGNLTRVAATAATDSDGDWRYYYDYENQMTKAEKYVTDTWVTKNEYARDALKRRIEKVAAGTTIRYYHDGWRVIEETEGTDTPTVERQYIFGNGIDEALVVFKLAGETYTPYYCLADRLWTVEALVNDSGAIVEAYAYRAYGEPTIKIADGGDGNWFDGDETTATSSALGNTIMFTGRNYDSGIGLYYYRMRMYEPWQGRFLSRDIMHYRDGMNLYEYTASQPHAGTDPLGLSHDCTEVKRTVAPGTKGMFVQYYVTNTSFDSLGMGTGDINCVCTIGMVISYKCCDGTTPTKSDTDYHLVDSGIHDIAAAELKIPVLIPTPFGPIELPGISANMIDTSSSSGDPRLFGKIKTQCQQKCASINSAGTDATKNQPKPPSVAACKCPAPKK